MRSNRRGRPAARWRRRSAGTPIKNKRKGRKGSAAED